MPRRIHCLALTLLVVSAITIKPVHLSAGSAIELLSGFDQERLQRTFPPTQPDGLSELCKLVYRLRSIDQKNLQKIADAEPAKLIGDATAHEGTLTDVKRVEVPESLQEYLGFKSLFFLQVKNNEKSVRVITSGLAGSAKAGDKINSLGILLASESEQTLTTIACGKVGWFANGQMNAGAKLLESNSFQLSLLAGLAERNRLPLMAQDGDAFYSMLETADHISEKSNLPQATLADPVMFLRDGRSMIGQWVRMEVEGVQITRIAVTRSDRQTQLDSDHYYQIDAIGDLGDVTIKMEPREGEPPVVFKTRYPISIAIKDLPDFLQSKSANSSNADEKIVRPFRGRLAMEGFFFRLWAYESEFMQQRGGSEQFGPLLIAVNLTDLEPATVNQIGVEKIGSLAAMAILTGILGIWIWQRKTTRSDQRVRQKRGEQQAASLSLDLGKEPLLDQANSHEESEPPYSPDAD